MDEEIFGLANLWSGLSHPQLVSTLIYEKFIPLVFICKYIGLYVDSMGDVFMVFLLLLC